MTTKITFPGLGTVTFRDGVAYVSSNQLTASMRSYQGDGRALDQAKARVEAVYAAAPADWRGDIADHDGHIRHDWA
jgi:hypothetical protein